MGPTLQITQERLRNSNSWSHPALANGDLGNQCWSDLGRASVWKSTVLESDRELILHVTAQSVIF